MNLSRALRSQCFCTLENIAIYCTAAKIVQNHCTAATGRSKSPLKRAARPQNHLKSLLEPGAQPQKRSK